MPDKNPIPVETLRQLLRYDPEAGNLFWLPRPLSAFQSLRHGRTWNNRNANRIAGRIDASGYCKIMLNKVPRYGHRIAWALHFGAHPEMDIDHINGVKSDNRITNLREVSHQDNMRNMKKSKINTSGCTGVHWIKRDKKWRAAITVNRKTIHIGVYDNFDDAVAARLNAERQYGFHPNHGT